MQVSRDRTVAPPQRTGGVALLSALLVVALATTAAAPMLSQLQLGMRKSANLFTRDQAHEYLVGIEQFALILLQRDRENNQVDHLDEFWARDLPPLPVEGGTITGRVTDLQSRLNINSLLNSKGKLDPLAQERLEALFGLLEIPVERVEAVIDWIDPDTEPTGNQGAEDNYYFSSTPPYRTANQRYTSADELRLLRDLTPAQAENLVAAVSIIPAASNVNVNTASDLTLQALGIDSAALDTVKNARPFDSLDAFKQLNLIPSDKLGRISVNTEYFLLEATARIGRAEQRSYSIIHRAARGGSPRIVARSLNTP
ncbi:MAG: type II secretion system minor pseudopilin GspK [Thiotrichales bacterium]